MIIKKLQEVAPMKNAHGIDARNLYNYDSAMITIMLLQSGEKLKKHITPVDVAFYLIEGNGIVEIGDEKQEVGPDTLIESPKDIMHCWYNESDNPLKIMVIKAPKPTTKTILVD